METKKYGPNERTGQSSRKNTSNEDAEFKTLVIRMLTEMVEYGQKMKKVKALKSEIKKNIQWTNSEGKETGTQINNLEQKEEITFNQNQMKKQEFKTMIRGLGTSGTI